MSSCKNCGNCCDYSNLGNNCTSQTNAFTSNRKFLTQTNPIYCYNYQNMMQYPGSDKNFIYAKGRWGYPDHIKTYFGKSFAPEYPYPSKLNPIYNLEDSNIDQLFLKENQEKNSPPKKCCGKI